MQSNVVRALLRPRLSLMAAMRSRARQGALGDADLVSSAGFCGSFVMTAPFIGFGGPSKRSRNVLTATIASAASSLALRSGVIDEHLLDVGLGALGISRGEVGHQLRELETNARAAGREQGRGGLTRGVGASPIVVKKDERNIVPNPLSWTALERRPFSQRGTHLAPRR